MKDVKILLEQLKITPHNLENYELAMTHSSKNGDRNIRHHDYERLEFIGDAVIGLVVAELAFTKRGDLSQGMMSKMRSQLVNTQALSKHARRLYLDQYIVLGNSLNGTVTDHILEDVFEAFTGAIYLDQGFSVAHDYLEDKFVNEVVHFDIGKVRDYKSALQEAMQAEHRQAIRYEAKVEGPSHAPMYLVEVIYGETILGRGKGTTKKAAEQEAAKDALKKMAKV
ncbi:MAG: ribonuclease III [Bacilli bacterium]|jgi:ribonuclease-3|nr:ribonuclease III [Bacilli bacterium]MCH4236120.1 ribonuclease III [Bacilli bacterium]